MAKIIEIDLDTNLVFPVNKPFIKKEMIAMLAQYWGYEKGEEKTIRKEFQGNFEDFKKEFEGQKYSVLSSENGVVIFDLTENVPHELSDTEWVLQRFIQPSMEQLRNIYIEIQTKKEQEEIEKIQEQIKANKENSLNALKALSNVKLG
jgi:hypothetical protein